MVIGDEEIISVVKLFLIKRWNNFHLPAEGKRINVVGPSCASTTD